MPEREDWAAEQDRLLSGYESVRARLLEIPSVVDVGVGLRRRAGELADEPVYIVYVVEKLPADDVPPGEMIPPVIDGIPTDVQTKIEQQLLLGFDDDEDWKNYDTKVGGIRIGADGRGATGTLGCLCTETATGRTVLLSNHHVLFGNDAVADSGVGQPNHRTSCCCTCNEIGKVVRGNSLLDCAIASVDSDVKTFPKIRRIKRSDGTVEQEGLIAGVAEPVLGRAVWKVGARTGLTRGTISQVVPEVTVDAVAAFAKIADSGDSGSVVIDQASGNVVALLYAIATGNPKIGFMNKISDVQTALGITVQVSDPTAVYTERLDEELDELFPLPAASPFEALVDRLRSSREARPLVEVAERHLDECLAIVDRRRGFTVAWHRNRGPAWLAALGRSARDPIYRLPEAIDGVERGVAIAAIVDALRAEAGAGLRADLDAVAPTLTPLLVAASSVDRLLTDLEAAGDSSTAAATVTAC